MDGCEIEFRLTIFIGRRVLKETNISGIGKQVGVSEGNQPEIPTALDNLVIMECEAPSKGDISDFSEIPENAEIKLTSKPIFTKINNKISSREVSISN